MSVQREVLPEQNVEDHLVSLQKSIEIRLEELEMKETHVKNLLKELESKEKAMNLGSMAAMDGKGRELLVLLNEHVGRQQNLHDGVFQVLKSCEEPGKLVLDAVKEFYSENGEMGDGGSVLRRSCVVLLEQLTRLRLRIVAPVKAEAATLAREWRAKMRMEDGKKGGGVLEVLGFLLLLGAYGLVDEFDIGEMLSVFESIGQQSERAKVSELGLDDKDPLSATLDSQGKIDRSSKEELLLVNQIASSFASRLEALKSFCVGMHGRSVKLFLYQHVELGYDLLCNEVCDALRHAPDPAKLVLDAIPGLFRSQPEFDKSLSIIKVRKSCILLLEQLMKISPQLNPHVREEALKMAYDWEANLRENFQRSVIVYGFLLFVATYGLRSNYDASGLLHLLGIASEYKASLVLCQVLGLADKVEVVIQTLIQKTLLLEAIDSSFAYEVTDKFQPLHLLKDYLESSKKIIYKKKIKQANLPQAIDKEIAVIRTVIKYIAKCKLESEYPPEVLEKQIVELENKKKELKTKQKKGRKSKGKAAKIIHSQVKAKTPQKEYLELVNQINSFSTGPRPQLESFSVNMDGRDSSYLSHDHVEEHDPVASSSDGPWPELMSFCINMEGKSLKLFLYNHAEEHDSMCSEVCNALQYAPDPAKLVLDAIPGFLHSQPEFDGTLSLNKVMKSCVLLLEQLMTISPAINPHVSEEALKMQNEWKADLGQSYQTGLYVYGFLHFIAAYGFTSSYEEDELLDLLATANQHKQSPSLCRILGLADKVVVSTSLDSQEKIDRSSQEELQLVNQIASSFANRLEALKYFCVGMDGRSLELFIYQHVELEYDSLCNEVCDALGHAPNPAKLILDTMPDFLHSQREFDKGLSVAKVRKSCILLLEQLMMISPEFSPHVREEALRMADYWGQIYQSPMTVYGFLLFLAAYGLNSNYEADELLRLLGIASQYKASPVLCQVFGLTDRVEVVIQTLIQKALLLEVVDSIYAYGVTDKFQPLRYLKGYLNYSKRRIYKKAKKTNSQQDQAIDKEIAAMRTVIKYIAKYKLESEYSPEDLEKQIVELENKKVAKIVPTRTKKTKQIRKESTILCRQVKVEESQKEYSNLDNRRSSFLSSPWPQLESFCINIDGRGSRLVSHNHVEEHDSVASSSTGPWPELKSFCINMDGKSLKLFLYNHAEEHDSMCSEVCDALQYAPDPAKLVLDAIPGFLRSQPEFDKSLSLKNIMKSSVLLLEQLMIISPAINPQVKEEALKMANEWKANLGQSYQTGLYVYGFLHFIAAYGFTTNYEEDELLDLLAMANQHEVSPGLCQILGLADKVIDLISNLIQKNLLLEAVEHIYAFEVEAMFQPVHLLKDYLKHSKEKIYKKGTISVSKQAIDKEIEAVRTVIKYISQYRLESEYEPENLENNIVELERRKRLL